MRILHQVSKRRLARAPAVASIVNDSQVSANLGELRCTSVIVSYEFTVPVEEEDGMP
jgi:hypothetical protein